MHVPSMGKDKTMLNIITISGRLTDQPDLRRTDSGIAVASFTLAVDRDFKSSSGERETDFIPCVAWRQTGEFVSNYFTKGQQAAVTGRLQIRKWKDKDGNSRSTAEVVAEHVYFCGSKEQTGKTAPKTDYGLIEEPDENLPF